MILSTKEDDEESSFSGTKYVSGTQQRKSIRFIVVQRLGGGHRSLVSLLFFSSANLSWFIMSTFPKLLCTILRERNIHTRARRGIRDDLLLLHADENDVFCFSASKALTSSLSSSSSMKKRAMMMPGKTTTTSPSQRRTLKNGTAARMRDENDDDDVKRNTTNTNTFRRAFVTGAASIFTASAAFFQTSSSAFAKLPEFQYEDSELRTAASGMQYADVVVGTGASPQKGQTIQAHYTGRLTNGRTFDSSYERGSPLKFKVGVRQVIQGWDDGILGAEGIEGMKVGGKRVLIIPPELGYGARGAGGVIPGNATLKFDVELVAVL
jgi:FKBP-type peptidyl-prolyl cis-trans isomerase